MRATPKPMRSPDSDDHLAAYFRQLAEHELLTPEDERELSQGIEDTEILTWERVFVARTSCVRCSHSSSLTSSSRWTSRSCSSAPMT